MSLRMHDPEAEPGSPSRRAIAPQACCVSARDTIANESKAIRVPAPWLRSELDVPVRTLNTTALESHSIDAVADDGLAMATGAIIGPIEHRWFRSLGARGDLERRMGSRCVKAR
jgi:hypothetical protein